MGLFKKEAAKEKASRFTDPNDVKINEVLNLVFDAFMEKGYNPYNQLMLYLYSEDEKCITTYNNARKELTALERDDIMKHLLRTYFDGR